MTPTTSLKDDDLSLRLHRSESWGRHADNCKDEDTKFISYWISLNALYGRAKYLDRSSDEWNDISAFVTFIETTARDALREVRPKMSHAIANVLSNRFLDRDCWKQWAENDERNKAKRLETATLAKNKSSDLSEVFRRLYELRTQIFHGCSTHGSDRNRETIAAANQIIGTLIPLFQTAVHDKGSQQKKLFNNPPYPPSAKDESPFTSIRTTRRR